jgi:hypothetical protein
MRLGPQSMQVECQIPVSWSRGISPDLNILAVNASLQLGGTHQLADQ